MKSYWDILANSIAEGDTLTAVALILGIGIVMLLINFKNILYLLQVLKGKFPGLPIPILTIPETPTGDKPNPLLQLKQLEKHKVIDKTRYWANYHLDKITEGFNATRFDYKSKCATEIDWDKRLWNVRALMNSKLMTFHINIKEATAKFITAYLRKDEKTLGEFENYSTWYDFMNDSITAYCDIARGKGVSEKLIHLFEKKHHSAETTIMSVIENNLSNGLYDNPIEVFSANLDAYYFALLMTINDLHAILTLNGELTTALEGWDFPERLNYNAD